VSDLNCVGLDYFAISPLFYQRIFCKMAVLRIMCALMGLCHVGARDVVLGASFTEREGKRIRIMDAADGTCSQHFRQHISSEQAGSSLIPSLPISSLEAPRARSHRAGSFADG
jgi:hypothetical protein